MTVTAMVRDWIVIEGDIASLVNSTDGKGGFEFFGPFTEEEAKLVQGGVDSPYSLAVQLLRHPRRRKS